MADEWAGTPLSKFVTSGLHSAHYIIKHLEQSKQGIESLLYNMPGIFVVFDAAGNILKSNENLDKSLGVSEGESIYRHLSEVFSDNSWESILSVLPTLSEEVSLKLTVASTTVEYKASVKSLEGFGRFPENLYYIVASFS